MIIALIVATLLLIAGAVWLTMKSIKCNELQGILRIQIEQSEDMFSELVMQRLQLDDRERYLNTIVDEIRKESDTVRQEKRNVEVQHEIVQQAVNVNNKILKANQLYLYDIRESMLQMITDYRKGHKLMSKALYGDEGTDSLQDLLVALQLKTIALEDNFIHNFKISPDEYKAKKINSTNSSLN